MRKIFCLALFGLLAIGCGSGGGGGADAAGPGIAGGKSVFSKWTNINSGSFIDLTGGTFGQAMSFAVDVGSGNICTCDLKVIGDEASGTYMLTNCFVSGGGTANCSAQNDIGTYSKANGQLELCADPGNCSKWQ